MLYNINTTVLVTLIFFNVRQSLFVTASNVPLAYTMLWSVQTMPRANRMA